MLPPSVGRQTTLLGPVNAVTMSCAFATYGAIESTVLLAESQTLQMLSGTSSVIIPGTRNGAKTAPGNPRSSGP
jgi:hypothetical protein